MAEAIVSKAIQCEFDSHGSYCKLEGWRSFMRTMANLRELVSPPTLCLLSVDRVTSPDSSVRGGWIGEIINRLVVSRRMPLKHLGSVRF